MNIKTTNSQKNQKNLIIKQENLIDKEAKLVEITKTLKDAIKVSLK